MSDKNNPKVSIICTVYNEEKFLGKMINSLVNQDYPNIEIIIVDDGSTDKTYKLLSNFKSRHSNLKIIKNKNNIGKVQSQNRAYELTNGDYIAIIGGDDYMSHDRISNQMKFLKYQQLDACFTNLFLIDENGNLLRNNQMFYNNTPFINSDKTSLIQGHSFPGNSIFFNRAMANMIYPIPKNLPYEDRWFSFVILLNGKMGYLSKPLTYYRQHNNNSWGILNKKELKTFILRSKNLVIREFNYLIEIKKYLVKTGNWDKNCEKCYRANIILHSENIELNFCKKFFILVQNFNLYFKTKKILMFMFPNLFFILKFYLR